MHFTDYDTRLAAYAVIVDDRERVLLALWNEADRPRWSLPGGGVELPESVQAGALREVREESGYDIVLGRLLGVHSYVIPPERRLMLTRRSMKAVRVVFEAKITGGELTREIDGSTDECRWFPLAEVPDLPQVELVGIALEMWRAVSE
ncbi:MAG: NUDIX domain-containing protein [Nocardioides sp.]